MVTNNKVSTSKVKSPDPLIITVILSLVTIGIFMIYSASGALAEHAHGDSFYFAKKQLLFAILGIVAMFFIAKINPIYFQTWAIASVIACYVLLIAVVIPGVGIVRNGATSWLGIGAFSIQPSEFMKLAMVLFLARTFALPGVDISSLKKGFIPGLAFIIVTFGVIMLQPDLGTGMVLAMSGVVVMFAAGACYQHLGGVMASGVVGFILLVLAAPYRVQRLVAFVNPWQDPLGAGYQLIQSLYAMGPGGLLGLGYGMSRQKYLYLPEPHTDFVYAIISEEMGFIMAGLIIMLFAIFAWRGFRIAVRVNDLFSSLVATGITSMIIIQAILNIGVVTGAFPVTGITLPFLSYGGSSLTLTLAAVGVLLNLSRHIKTD